MLDIYLHGSTSRISPEAPVPIVKVDHEEMRIGGAGNVAVNAAALGAQVTLLGLVGQDSYAKMLMPLIQGCGIAVDFQSRVGKSTIVKKRVIAKNHQLLRIDHETEFDRSDAVVLTKAASEWIPKTDVVILSDYGKGSLLDIENLINRARGAGKVILVDPKGADFARYRGASVITPNLSEFEAVVGSCSTDLDIAEKATLLCRELNIGALLITKSERGMTLIRHDSEPLHLPALAREVYDVTGAGDTVIATVGAALGAGRALEEAVSIANVAAGIVVAKFGTASVSTDELSRDIERNNINYFTKITDDLPSLVGRLSMFRNNHETIVVTNGCFDILHPGHMAYLEQAKNLGDRLVVLVNDDKSVKMLKGSSRPINDLKFRMAMLSAIQYIDVVCPFSGETPLEYIRTIGPDVLVKGGDYSLNEIVGADLVLSRGGSVEVIPFVDGFSSSSLINKIRDNL